MTSKKDTIMFVVNGKPIGKGRPRFTNRGGFVRAYTPRETTNYEKKIADTYKEKYGDRITDKPVRLVVTAVFPIPKAFRKQEKEDALNGRIAPTKKPDIDNILKTVMDGLNGVAYNDDAQVVLLHGRKKYTDYIDIAVAEENPEQYDIENGYIVISLEGADTKRG